MRYVAISGTHGTDGTTGDRSQWWQPTSAWAQWMAARNWYPADAAEPYVWSGDVDGDLAPWQWGKRRHADWEAGAAALTYYLRTLTGGASDVVLIAHSHGGQLAKLALASRRCPRVHGLVTVCSPVRKDMDLAATAARLTCGYWLHIADPGVASNFWQAAGSLFDGRWGWTWSEPLASRTDLVRGLGIGHSGVLDDPTHFDMWHSRGWLRELEMGGLPGSLGTATAPAAEGPVARP